MDRTRFKEPDKGNKTKKGNMFGRGRRIILLFVRGEKKWCENSHMNFSLEILNKCALC